MALVALLAACAGQPTASPDAALVDAAPMTDEQRGRSFDAIIRPLVTECATGPCHTGQPPLLTSYAAMTAVPALRDKYTQKPGATNILVTKGGPTNTHSGQDYFSVAEQQMVAAWIDSL